MVPPVRSQRHARPNALWCVLALGAHALACPSPNTYATPRTLAPGDVSQMFAVEGLGVAGPPKGSFTPTPPVYEIRVGVAERADVGVRLAHFATLGADLKLLLAKGVVDVAIAPGASAGPVLGANKGLIAFATVPVLLGFNVNDTTTVTASAGYFMPLAFTADDAEPTSTTGRMRDTYPAGRFGLGIDLHPLTSFALHPEITVIYARPDGRDLVVITPGVGITFSAQPSYEDLAAE